jgi:hypothetical protein
MAECLDSRDLLPEQVFFLKHTVEEWLDVS